MRFTVWTQQKEIQYSTTLLSKASVFYVISTLLTVIPPLLIAYRSQGFWMKVSTYREQPKIHFTNNFLVILEKWDNDYLIWSTNDEHLTSETESRVRIPATTWREQDWNRDGIPDSLHLDLNFPLRQDETVTSVQALLLFNYQLNSFSYFEMTGLVYLNGAHRARGVANSIGQAGHTMHTLADVRLHQRQLLPNKGRDNRYLPSPLPENSGDPVDVISILRENSKRNMSLRLENRQTIWKQDGSVGFRHAYSFINVRLSVDLTYPEETVEYKPGFWQMIKWGWLQYLAVLVIFVYIFHSVKTFVFSNQILPTLIHNDSK